MYCCMLPGGRPTPGDEQSSHTSLEVRAVIQNVRGDAQVHLYALCQG